MKLFIDFNLHRPLEKLKENFVPIHGQVMANRHIPFERRAIIIGFMEQAMLKADSKFDIVVYVPNYNLIEVKRVGYHFLDQKRTHIF